MLGTKSKLQNLIDKFWLVFQAILINERLPYKYIKCLSEAYSETTPIQPLLCKTLYLLID